MSPAIKPIEIKAYGRRFRSRLEARWAVFFTEIGLSWEYEPEGFDIDGLAYLPDFRVWTPQGMPAWYEVKPRHVRHDSKFERFITAVNSRGSLLNGDPLQCLQESHSMCPRCGLLDKRSETKPDVWRGPGDVNIIAYLCEPCDFETPCSNGNPVESDGVNGTKYEPEKGWLIVSPVDYMGLVRDLFAAAQSAMSARFEHGESPSF